jgi:hypothetical protein
MRSIPRTDPDVVIAAMPGGDMILLHLGTGQYMSLNETGAFLWKLMDDSTSLADMCRALFDRFEVTPEAAEEAVRDLMRELKSHRLITISDPGADWYEEASLPPIVGAYRTTSASLPAALACLSDPPPGTRRPLPQNHAGTSQSPHPDRLRGHPGAPSGQGVGPLRGRESPGAPGSASPLLRRTENPQPGTPRKTRTQTS